MEARVQRQLILGVLPQAHWIIGDDAARHMLHYLNNNGTPLVIDLEGMIREVPSARRRFENEINQARRYVEMLPEGSHEITSRRAEAAYNLKSETQNWYFAVGGYSTWGKGRAIVRRGPAGREYNLEFEYRFFDRRTFSWRHGAAIPAEQYFPQGGR